MKRFEYNPDGFSSLDESTDGEWVRYEEHAADRAALVAQVTELTRERDEAQAKLRHARYTAQVRWGGFKPDWPVGARDVYEALDADGYSHSNGGVDGVVGNQEFTRLTEALAAAEREASEFYSAGLAQGERLDAAEARVRELERRVAMAVAACDPDQPGSVVHAFRVLEALRG